MGQQVRERFQKKHPPTFHTPDNEEVKKARESYKESLKKYRKALKEMKEAQEQWFPGIWHIPVSHFQETLLSVQ